MVEKIKREREGEWHVLESTFSREDGLEPASVDGVPVLVPGKIGDVPVVQIPASATPEMFERISKAITEAIGVEPFIITSNVQLLKFRRVDDRTAKNMMRAAREKMEAMRAGVEAKAGDGDGSQPDGIGSGDAGADDAEGDTDDRVEAPAQPGEEPAQEG